MTKHIIGLIIFTLIVGTSVIVYGIFGYFPNSNSYTCKTKKYRKYKKKQIKKHVIYKRHHKKINVSQAVFDKRNNQLTTRLKFNMRNYKQSFSGKVDLHFFVKDEFGTQYLKKETVDVSSNKDIYEHSFGWLNRLETRKNLYVMAKFVDSSRNYSYQPRFRASEAVAVLSKTAE